MAEYEMRAIPDDNRLTEAARAQPGGWVYEIDFDYAADEEVPPEAIRGAWEVSARGALTGRYRGNERHRPIVECDRSLAPYAHAAAKSSPGKWVCEIEPRGEHLFPDIPDAMIRGWWLIGKDGKITKFFRANAKHESE